MGLMKTMQWRPNRIFQIDRLVRERRNSSALALELRLSCTTNPSKRIHAINVFVDKYVVQKLQGLIYIY